MYINTGTYLNASQSKLYVVFIFQKFIAVEILFFKNYVLFIKFFVFQWARDEFEGLFKQAAENAYLYITYVYKIQIY